MTKYDKIMKKLKEISDEEGKVSLKEVSKVLENELKTEKANSNWPTIKM